MRGDAGQRGDAPIVIDVVVARDVMHGPRTQRGALLVRVRVKSAGSRFVTWVEEGEREGLAVALVHPWVMVRARASAKG